LPITLKFQWAKWLRVKVEIDPSELVERSTDDRGRIYLGSEYANQNVKVLVLND